MIDSFSSPASQPHTSLPCESRAAFPPGTAGDSILSIASGTDIAMDRGLFGLANSLVAGGGPVPIDLFSGETRDVYFNAIGGETDFARFRLINKSQTTFNGTLRPVSAIPEPSYSIGLVKPEPC